MSIKDAILNLHWVIKLISFLLRQKYIKWTYWVTKLMEALLEATFRCVFAFFFGGISIFN